jgi:hypothetical protein
VIIETLLEGVRKGPSLLFRKECFDNTRIFDYQNSKSLHPLDHFTRWITSPAGSLHPLDHFTRWITSPVRSPSLCEKRGLVCIPSKGMGLCRYGIFGQDLIQPTLCLKYRPSVVSENLCVCSVAFHDMVSSLSYGGCPLLPLSFYNIAKRLTNR